VSLARGIYLRIKVALPQFYPAHATPNKAQQQQQQQQQQVLTCTTLRWDLSRLLQAQTVCPNSWRSATVAVAKAPLARSPLLSLWASMRS